MPFTDDEYQQAIDALPDEFTSHEFILRLAWMFQQTYISFLYDYREYADPFRVAHSRLAARLNEWETLEAIGQVVDEDIFRHPNGNVQWRKRP